MVSTDDSTERTQRAIALARTYGSDHDGWERVEEYQRVQRWRAKHPDRASGAASTALELPRGRIRPWFGGAKPDPVHAVETAEMNGWLDATPRERCFEALSVLSAWIFAGGAIARSSWAPSFTVAAGDPDDLAAEALHAVGVPSTIVRPDAPGRAPERRVTEDSSALGRYLHAVFGAPLGTKSGTTDLSLPAWLSDAPLETHRRWGRLYVTLRGTAFPEEHGYVLQLGEERNDEYLAALGDFLNEATSVDDGVRLSGGYLRITEDAAAELDVVPELPK